MAMDLRRQFLNFMTVERFSDHTKRLYLRSVIGLVKFYSQSPDTLTNEQIQEYFRHLIEDRKLPRTNGAPGRTICANAQQIIASAIACATLAAVLTGPIAPDKMKGTTTIPCPRPQ